MQFRNQLKAGYYTALAWLCHKAAMSMTYPFLSTYFGMVTAKPGINWMVNFHLQPQQLACSFKNDF